MDGNQQYSCKSFLNSFKKVKVKNFKFTCDICVTRRENNQASTINEQISELTQTVSKLVSIQSNKDEQIATLTTTVNALITDFQSLKQVISEEPKKQVADDANSKPWENINRVASMKASLCIKSNGTPVNMEKVKEVATANNIQVTKAVLKDNGDVIVHMPTEENRSKLTTNLQSHDFEENEVIDIKNKLPTISILNVKSFTSKEEFIEKVKCQNPLIREKLDNGSEFSIVYSKQPREGENTERKKFCQVVARVSNDIMQVIKRSGYKIYMDLVAHRVVDRFFVKRCNKCQKFGHYQNDCKEERSSCGYCCQNHLSHECEVEVGDFDHYNCVNCKRENKKSKGHSAHWYNCPSYVEAQKKVKKSIPYYQKN